MHHYCIAVIVWTELVKATCVCFFCFVLLAAAVPLAHPVPVPLLKGQTYWDHLVQQLDIPQSSRQHRPPPRKPAFLFGLDDDAVEWTDSVPNVKPPPPTLPPPSMADISSLTLLSSTVSELSPWKQVAKGDEDNPRRHMPQQGLLGHQEATTRPKEESQQSMNPLFSEHASKLVTDVHPPSRVTMPLCSCPTSGDTSLHSQSTQSKPSFASCPQMSDSNMAPGMLEKRPVGTDVSLTDLRIQREVVHIRDTLRMVLELKTQQR